MSHKIFSITVSKIAFIGAGRFGRFFGSRISNHYPVRFYDNQSKEGLTLNEFWEALESEYIFITIPISAIENFLKEHANEFKPGTVIVDCASVKMKPVEWYKKYLPDNVEYIFTHPLFGPDSGRNGLAGHKITVQPGKIGYANYNFIIDLFKNKLGLNTLYYSAEDHDRFMAYNLTFIHQLGRTLADMGIHKVELKMNGLTYLDQISTVVMNDSDRLFRDFYTYNPYSKEILDNFMQSFDKVRRMLG